MQKTFISIYFVLIFVPSKVLKSYHNGIVYRIKTSLTK